MAAAVHRRSQSNSVGLRWEQFKFRGTPQVGMTRNPAAEWGRRGWSCSWRFLAEKGGDERIIMGKIWFWLSMCLLPPTTNSNRAPVTPVKG